LVSPNQSASRLAISGIQIIDGTVATTDLVKNENFTLYPNPNQGILNINPIQHEPILITIYDMMGKQVYSEKIYNQVSLDLINGYYFVEILTDRGRFIEPLIITRQ
jgi:hypothetical protein